MTRCSGSAAAPPRAPQSAACPTSQSQALAEERLRLRAARAEAVAAGLQLAEAAGQEADQGELEQAAIRARTASAALWEIVRNLRLLGDP
jgi:hypothetical protein